MRKNITLFGLLTILFSALIFLGETFVGGISGVNIREEKFLDKSLYGNSEDNKKINYIEVAKDIIKTDLLNEIEKERRTKEIELLKKKYIAQTPQKSNIEAAHEHSHNDLSSAREIHFGYIPREFISTQLSDSREIAGVLKNKIFEYLYSRVNIEMHEQRPDVRGKMKNKTIKLFGPQDMEQSELLSVFLHEFAHYIDLYFFQRNDGNDISNKFYSISWYSTIVMLPGGETSDFVSGYAMTNKYEDFAESLTYYIFHNDDFLTKAERSDILKEKYKFFREVLFTNTEFTQTDFSANNTVKDYYRDITKIDFSTKNFLQYLENEI